MKTFKLLWAVLALTFGFASFSSCGTDDNDDVATPAARDIDGTYTADISCSVMGEASDFENMTFTVTATGDATVDITIPTFGEMPMQVPEFTVTGVKVSGADGTYTLDTTTFSGTLPNGKSYSGTLQGSYKDSRLSVQFNLQYGAMPMPMICSWTAPKN
jgi:hypothetical protein